MKAPGPISAWIPFDPGLSVVIDAGPFQGVRGMAVGISHEQRLFVLVRLLRGAIVLDLDSSCVRIESPMRSISRARTH